MSLTVVIIVTAFGLVCLSEWRKKKIHDNWLRLPTVDSYYSWRRAHQQRNGCSCHRCESRSIRQFGLEARHDRRRIHACNHCNTHLYRTVR
jgi:hypothetical protein